jgi:hypothetical protein
MNRASRLWRPFRRLTWRFWLTFLLACAMVVGGEYYIGLLIDNNNPEAVGAFFAFTGLYQRLLAAARVPEVRHTVIVEINSAKDLRGVSNSMVCPEREFLSQLLRRIDEDASPVAIVVDKYFGRTSCPDDDPDTLDLTNRVRSIRGKRHNLVLGLLAKNLEQQDSGPATPKSFLDDALKFDAAGLAHQEGVVNIAQDARRLPLQWRIYKDSSRSDISVLDTLALATALAVDPDLRAKDPRLDRVITSAEQPFIGFLGEDKWEAAHAHFYASEVLCGRRADPSEKWQTCEGKGPVPDQLNHKVIVIGEHDERSDQHESVVGSIQGYYLQANYIEALLDSQFLRPGGPMADYGLGFLFLLALELILIVLHERVGEAILWIGILVVTSYVFLVLIVLVAKVYVDPVPVSAAACAIKILHLIHNKIGKMGQVRRR